MLKEILETGKTVDAAINSACEKLGCSREDCEWEIIDLPRKGFLGLKHIPAKVKVSIVVPDEKPAVVAQTEQKPKSEPRRKPVAEQKSQVAPRQQPTEKPRRESRAQPLTSGEISEKEELAKQYIADIIDGFGLSAKYVVTHEHGGSCISIEGDGLGMIIGRRGETLDAIQYLAGLVANRGEGDYLRLTVDCGDYRLKRKNTLEGLAHKLASQVLKTNVSKTLEPMNPFERRIIHATVSEIEGVSSASVGEEPNRRVIITSPTARPASRGTFRSGSREGGNRRADQGGYNRGRGPREDDRPAGENAGNAQRADGERPPRALRESSGRDDRGDRGGFNRGGRGRDDRGSRGDRGDRGDRRSRQPSQPRQVQVGPPKQTPEAEATNGISFGKIDLD